MSLWWRGVRLPNACQTSLSKIACLWWIAVLTHTHVHLCCQALGSQLPQRRVIVFDHFSFIPVLGVPWAQELLSSPGSSIQVPDWLEEAWLHHQFCRLWRHTQVRMDLQECFGSGLQGIRMLSLTLSLTWIQSGRSSSSFSGWCGDFVEVTYTQCAVYFCLACWTVVLFPFWDLTNETYWTTVVLFH